MKMIKEILSLLTVVFAALFIGLGISTLLVTYLPIWIAFPALISFNSFIAYTSIYLIERM